MLRHLRLQRPLCVIDVETTGLDPAGNRVVDVAVLRLDPHRPAISFVRRVNPGVPIPARATAVHRIRDADVAACPSFERIARMLLGLLGGADLGGFGIRQFDLPFLAWEFQRAGQALCRQDRAVLDAQTIFHARERRDLAAALRF
jgi:DNA polymerase-3 subunit epsilon